MQIGWANVSSALNIQLNHSHRLASLLLITKTERKTASQFKLEPNSQTPWAREEEANVIKLSAHFPFVSSPAFFSRRWGFPSLTMWIVPLTHRKRHNYRSQTKQNKLLEDTQTAIHSLALNWPESKPTPALFKQDELFACLFIFICFLSFLATHAFAAFGLRNGRRWKESLLVATGCHFASDSLPRQR